MDVQDTVIQFEQDEEGNYRALFKDSPVASENRCVNKPFIEAISKVLTLMTRRQRNEPDGI
ncbi:hypothetical protein [Mucilaginibacter agri]|uniref:Uncharacterized protein n=1 Tax=Mucilaginibacter agri TaxID=2695265 RepID=A0A965ZE39_9SPHI|nr:hypothetical protein [Mucilaginibacter agri]NCD68324.1 hypothetical protein [Mucilaginibacter agri]